MAASSSSSRGTADSRSGRRGGMLPWALLVAGSVASLAANVTVAEPALIGRVIAAWPSFALTASFELLTRQVRRGAASRDAHHQRRQPQPSRQVTADSASAPGVRVVGPSWTGRSDRRAGGDLRRQAWHWALAHRSGDGALPSGEAIARAQGRQERWGRLVKNAGQAGAFGAEHAPLPRLASDEAETLQVVRPDVSAVSRGCRPGQAAGLCPACSRHTRHNRVSGVRTPSARRRRPEWFR